MYKVGDVIVYKKDVCEIKDIKKNLFFDKDYYVMSPIDDTSLKIEIPVDSSYLRDVITLDEVQELICKIPSIEIIQVEDKDIEYEYRKLLGENTLENLVKIIKTTYLRNQERVRQKKRGGEKDEYYLQQAERHLYNELSISLNLSFDEAKQYVIDSVIHLLT